MTSIKHTRTEEAVVFTAEAADPGFLHRLFGGTKQIENIDDWVAGDVARCDALGTLRMYGEANPGEVRFEDERLVASHAAIAALRTSQARSLGLPARPPFAFSADASGVIGSPNFKLVTRWLDAGRPVPAHRSGTFLETSQGEFLIPEPLYSAVELSERFDAGKVDLPEHWAVLSHFRNLLEPSIDSDSSPIELSRFLQGLRIYTGVALSLALDEVDGEIGFEPILFDSEASRKALDEGLPLTERDGMLPEDLLHAFQKDPATGFRAFDAAKRSYLLGQNTYLVVDDDIEVALRVVREKQRAGPEERRAFAANPRAAITDRLIQEASEDMGAQNQESAAVREEEIEARVASLFVETPEYADRAIGIGVWEKPELDFLPYAPSVWLPETFALNLDGIWVELDQDSVQVLREEVTQAIDASQPEVKYRGQCISATEEVRQTLAGVIGKEDPKATVEEEGESDTSDDDNKDILEKPDKTVVVVHQNYVEENWRPEIPSREVRIHLEPPSKISTELLGHQKKALKWQVEAWRAGLPGVLNADDQGLGKTLQTLAFLAWLQTNMAESSHDRRKPVLVVAPKGLLRTWESEEEAHLKGTRLGAQIKAYGHDLKNLRKPGLTGKDTDDGVPRLDFGNLRLSILKGKGHQNWVLTTYETLANYQHSFRQIDFSVVVFDEIQKIKNVATLASLAARGIKADFRVGLTGTPIENHVADLWAIMDAVAPGRLRSMKEFVERYRIVTEEGMDELHGRLFKEVESNGERYPPIAQRRFKEVEIECLPRKDYRVHPLTMPDSQASAYEAARQHLVDGGRGSGLRLLHHIRSVSLHPEPPETATSVDDYFVHSARFLSMRNILRRIHANRERALIFTEDRRVQAFIAQWARSKFGLADVPIINGATSIVRRQQYVNRFQEHVENDRGFDIMILSPRAAGVGLTLTAATHVIHLSRWWNPAVEEQCNDRIYRIGQKSDVTVHLPLAIHPTYQEISFDCVLNNLMRRKTSLARAALWPPTNSDFDVGMLIAGINGAEPINLPDVDGLDWAGFEDWIMERARESGDWMVSETPRSGDGGADAVLRHCRRRNTAALIQAKHTSDRSRLINDAAVREVVHAAKRYDVENPQLVVITNARGFTRKAQDAALEHFVTLLDRDRLALWPNHVLG
ncbi:MAG: SNF2-related protein [Gammaproteobacteria bacterium]|nr:SNF2-related protein [Gammaproteobacteria bacterium]